jgi:hypothetical protein
MVMSKEMKLKVRALLQTYPKISSPQAKASIFHLVVYLPHLKESHPLPMKN